MIAPDVLSDLSLARRLERAEAVANARFVDARARLAPGSGAEWTEIAGAYAMYDGPRSPSTQTFGLGVFEIPTARHMERLEEFFQDRGAPVFHEVSPITGKPLLDVLNERGYRPVEFTSVMFQPLNAAIPVTAAEEVSVRIRMVGEKERELWARTMAEGWRELTEIADLMLDVARLASARRDAPLFLAELDGQPIATGALAIHDGVALLAGASTIPEWRHRGAQRALLASRLDYARHAGCELAMIGAEPGSASQRNAERQGFRIAYTRIKWALMASQLRSSEAHRSMNKGVHLTLAILHA